MNGVIRKESGECAECGQRLRNSVFCMFCAEVLCSWGCYLRHVVVHAGDPAPCTSPAAVIEPRSTGELAGGKADLPRIECRA